MFANNIFTAISRGLLPLVQICLVALAIPASAHALTVSTQPANPAAFEPFDVVVQFSQAYCLPRASPIVAQTVSSDSASGRSITVLLSHLDVVDPSVCVMRTSSRVKLPGLAPGLTTLEIGLTQSYQPSPLIYRSQVVERGSVQWTVLPTANRQQRVYTINGPNGAPFYLSTINAQNTSGSGSLVPVADVTGAAPSIFAWTIDRVAVPSVATPLYKLHFLNPSRYFYTTSTIERDTLLRGGQFEQFPWNLYVVPATNGACPLGTLPVRRVFNQADLLHRYEISMDTVAVLTANGYVDENIAFCSPPAP